MKKVILSIMVFGFVGLVCGSARGQVAENIIKLKKSENCKGCFLKRANLEGANLEGVDLKGANLEGANLKGTNLEGVKLIGGFTTARVSLQLGREPLGFEINERAYEHFKPRFHKKR